jgi:hypothetical protein
MSFFFKKKKIFASLMAITLGKPGLFFSCKNFVRYLKKKHLYIFMNGDVSHLQQAGYQYSRPSSGGSSAVSGSSSFSGGSNRNGGTTFYTNEKFTIFYANK